MKVRLRPSFLLEVPSCVKTAVERQSPLATVGSVVRVTLPLFTVNWIRRKPVATASWSVLPL